MESEAQILSIPAPMIHRYQLPHVNGWDRRSGWITVARIRLRRKWGPGRISVRRSFGACFREWLFGITHSLCVGHVMDIALSLSSGKEDGNLLDVLRQSPTVG
jgi:hypothetical protein